MGVHWKVHEVIVDCQQVKEKGKQRTLTLKL